jgi:hypothetical protein
VLQAGFQKYFAQQRYCGQEEARHINFMIRVILPSHQVLLATFNTVNGIRLLTGLGAVFLRLSLAFQLFAPTPAPFVHTT